MDVITWFEIHENEYNELTANNNSDLIMSDTGKCDRSAWIEFSKNSSGERALKIELMRECINGVIKWGNKYYKSEAD